MPDLVTLAQAKRHLRLGEPDVPSSEEDADLVDKIAQASALVIDYVSQRISETDAGSPPTTWAAEVATWDVNSSPPALPPPIVQAATLVQLAELWRYRGDDPANDAPMRTPGFLSPMVVSLLYRYRDPALS